MDNRLGLSDRESQYQMDSPNQMLSKFGSIIYRLSRNGDRWSCKSCSLTYDKWGMIDHLCIKNGRKYTEPPRGATGYSTTHVVDNEYCRNQEVRKRMEINREPIELSPKAKEIFQRNKEARQQTNQFVGLQPGEKRVFEFDPEKTEIVEKEFNGKKSLRFRYSVMEDGSIVTKYFEVSKRTSEDIDALLIEGHTRLKIQRSGSGIDTRYLIVPVYA